MVVELRVFVLHVDAVRREERLIKVNEWREVAREQHAGSKYP